MPRSIIPLVLACVLIIVSCTNKPKQSTEAQPGSSNGAPSSDVGSNSGSNTTATTPAANPASGSGADTNGTGTASQQSAKASDVPLPQSQWKESPRENSASTESSNSSKAVANREPSPPPPPPVIAAGSVITIRLGEAIDSKENKPGDTFKGSVAQPLIVKGETLIPKGSEVSGTVVDAVAPGKLKGEGRLSIKLTEINIRGVTYPITTAVVSNTLHGKGKRSAGLIGGGAGGGALIRGLAGGGKGAALGGLLGGAAGAAGATLTGNQQLAFTAESALTFKLQQPLTLKNQNSPTAQISQQQQ